MDLKNTSIDAAYARASDRTVYGHSGICAHLPRMVDLVKEAAAKTRACCVVELGVGGGDQSTIAWLYALKNLGPNGALHCYDQNAPANLPDLHRLAAEQGTKFTFTRGDTLTAKSQDCDILFVDTLHTKEQVAKELNIFASKTSQFIAFHDTEAFKRHGQFLKSNNDNTGVLDAVEEFVISNNAWGLKAHYLDDNGFLILAKHNLLPSKLVGDAGANVAAVIGTFAAVPYVHLSLHALRKHEPNLKIAVHDDCSPKGHELLRLCQKYDAHFYTLKQRARPTLGDMSAMAYTARYAYNNNCQIGVKLSRRFIINRPFADELRYIFCNMQSPTVCGADAAFNFGFRSEAVCMWAPAWIEAGVVDEMEQIVAKNMPYHSLPEAWYHNRAKFLHCCYRSKVRVKYDSAYPLADARAGFSDWSLLGLSRTAPAANVLWHDSHRPADYAELAAKLGLPYTAADFNDPNMGFGSTP